MATITVSHTAALAPLHSRQTSKRRLRTSLVRSTAGMALACQPPVRPPDKAHGCGSPHRAIPV